MQRTPTIRLSREALTRTFPISYEIFRVNVKEDRSPPYIRQVEITVIIGKEVTYVSEDCGINY